MKVSVIGAAGKVGSAISYSLLPRVDELVLVDIAEDKVEGEYFDLSQAAGERTELSWGKDPSSAEDCDLVIIPAGVPRTPDTKTRMDLLKKNALIVKGVVEEVAESSPDALLLVISNPMDVMTYLSLKVSGFDSSKVIGMGGTLDSRRLRWVLSQYSDKQVEAITIGAHGEDMVPLLSKAKIGGKPLSKDFIQDKRDELVSRVKKFGSRIIKKKGGTWWGPAQATMDVVDAIIKGPRVVPVSVLYEGVCIGLPARVGKKGVLEIIEPELDKWEKARFIEAMNSLGENCRWVDEWLEK